MNPLSPDNKNVCSNFSIELSIMDWHKLLKQLEFCQQICNRDTDTAVDLWEQISTQLSNGTEQVIQGSAKYRRMFPEKVAAAEAKMLEKAINEQLQKPSTPAKKVGLFDKIRKRIGYGS